MKPERFEQIEPEVAAAIQRLSENLAVSSSSADVRAAAQQTGGVPVYADLGGVLVVAPDGGVLRYDPETKTVMSVEDKGWKALARLRAAQQFGELASLRPVKPRDGLPCAQCAGTGLVLGIRCSECVGLGWVP